MILTESRRRPAAGLLAVLTLLATLFIQDRAAAPARAAAGEIAAGTRLDGGATVLSPSGKYKLALQSDGNFVLYAASGGAAIWNTVTFGHPGAYLLMQDDGNLVLYAAEGRPIWASHTVGRGGSALSVQDDGNVVMRTQAGAAVWATDTVVRGDTLRRGERLGRGEILRSQSGAYTAYMQTDGNFVVYRDGWLPLWWTNSVGWLYDFVYMQEDGNLVLYSSAMVPLYATNTWGTAGSRVVMQNDGNLVLYTDADRPLWATQSVPIPTDIYPPQTSVPPASSGRYVRNVLGAGHGPLMDAEGCQDASASPSGFQYLHVLAWGAQRSSVNGSWGVQLTVTSVRITEADLVSLMKAYLNGYVRCMRPNTRATIAVSTNNDGAPDVLGAAGGERWARDVVNPLADYIRSNPRIVIAGSNDIEPGFAGTQQQALDWTNGYLRSTGAPYVWIGSADGCPTVRGERGLCNYGWTQSALAFMAWGAAPERSLPLPQIYVTAQAPQWANIGAVSAEDGRPAVRYAGALTEWQACQVRACSSKTPAEGWTLLWSNLNATALTRQSGLPYVTDLRIDE